MSRYIVFIFFLSACSVNVQQKETPPKPILVRKTVISKSVTTEEFKERKEVKVTIKTNNKTFKKHKVKVTQRRKRIVKKKKEDFFRNWGIKRKRRPNPLEGLF